MAKYTFICEEEPTPYSTYVESKKTIEFRADGLNDVLQQFEDFLRAAGFHFDGVLDVIDESKYDFDDTGKEFDFSEIPQNNWPFSMKMPGTIGGAEINFVSEK